MFSKDEVLDSGTYTITRRKILWGRIAAAIIGGLMLLGMITDGNKKSSQAAPYSQSR